MLEVLDRDGSHVRRELRADGPHQAVVPGGCAFAAHVPAPDGLALVGCDVAPGFDFADFELCDRASLTAAHPRHAALIARFTR